MRRDKGSAGMTGSAPKGRTEPTHARLETALFPYEQLTEDQKNAADRALLLLADMATIAWKKRPEEHGNDRFLPAIEPCRWNSVVLLDGGRGSGKTTLFLSLLDAWCSTWRESGRGAATDELMPRYPGSPDVLRSLVPLEILDLHPLPETTHLSLYIAERFRRVIEVLRPNHKPEERGAPAFRPSRGAELKSAELWRRFIQAAASGWDGNLEQRKANLDPEDYAVELEQTERRRLAVSSSFYAFLDALTDEFTEFLSPTEQPPLFIVPIDDADMNPQRSVELLSILRTLWHPRVAFLLTGDTELFLSTLRAHFLGQFRRNLEGLNTNDHRTLSGRADHVHLAEEVYRRVIPPGHRCELPALRAGLRLAKTLHFPIDQAGPKVPDEEDLSISRCLADMRAHPDAPTVAEYFKEDEQLPEALPDRLRGLRDLLDALRHERKQMTAWDLVLRLWREAVRRATLTPEQRRALSRAVRPAATTEDGKAQGIAVATQMLVWRPLLQELGRDDDLPLRGSLVLRRPMRYEVSMGPKSEANDTFSAGMTATLMLACNIAADDPKSYFVGPSPAPGGTEDVFATVELESDSLDQILALPWPMPDWESFHDVALFAKRWEALLWRFPAKSNGTAPIARGFLEAILDVGERSAPSATATLDRWSEMLETDALGETDPQQDATDHESIFVTSAVWAKLAERLARLAKLDPQREATDRERIFSRWALSRAALLAAPEAGLQPADANAYLDAWMDAFKSAPNMREAVRRERRRNLRRVVQRAVVQGKGERSSVENRLEELIEELDAMGDYRWNAIIEGRTSARNQDRSLLQHLEPIIVAHQRESFTRRLPRSVSGYARGDREQAFLASGAEGKKVASPLAEFRGAAGGASAAMASAWSVAVSPEDHTLREHVRGITVGTDQMRLKLDDRIIRRTTTSVVAYPLANGYTVQLGYGTTLVAIENPFLNALYRVIWDVAADEQDLDPEGQAAPVALREDSIDVELAYWDAIGIQVVPSGLTFSWFVPSWPALFDWEMLDASWRPLVYAAAAAMARPDVSRQAVVDALAYRLLDAILFVVEQRREAETVWTGELPTARDWRDLVQRIRAPRKRSYKGRRWRAFSAFRAALPLMAAPESGLSAPAAEAIVASVKLSVGELRHLPALRQARAQRSARLSGTSDLKAKDILASIDRALPDHPWIVIEKKRSSTS